MLVTGSSGRIGRLLRLLWRQEESPAIPVFWASRPSGEETAMAPGAAAEEMRELAWVPGAPLPAAWPEGAVILHLAGRISGDKAALAENVALARAVAGAAVTGSAAHVLFASSVAVYRPGGDAISETAPPVPRSAYGRSKAAAEAALADGLAGSTTRLTCLRIGNLVGADALIGGALGRNGPVLLDWAAGCPDGPERSYIGPQNLARALARLADLAATSPEGLPALLNLTQPGAVAMGNLLTAAGLDWRFGPRAAPAPRLVVDTSRLGALVQLPPAGAETLIADLAALESAWP